MPHALPVNRECMLPEKPRMTFYSVANWGLVQGLRTFVRRFHPLCRGINNDRYTNCRPWVDGLLL